MPHHEIIGLLKLLLLQKQAHLQFPVRPEPHRINTVGRNAPQRFPHPFILAATRTPGHARVKQPLIFLQVRRQLCQNGIYASTVPHKLYARFKEFSLFLSHFAKQGFGSGDFIFPQ